jgi:hypothetical protein
VSLVVILLEVDTTEDADAVDADAFAPLDERSK